LFWNGWNCEWEEDGVQWGKFKGKKVLMRKVITFLECYVQREFHHDNLLRWVFLLVDMNEREREGLRENEKNSSSFQLLYSWMAPSTYTFSYFFLTSVLYFCLIYLYSFHTFKLSWNSFYLFFFFHYFSSFPCFSFIFGYKLIKMCV
jgi:hypothetical protein